MGPPAPLFGEPGVEGKDWIYHAEIPTATTRIVRSGYRRYAGSKGLGCDGWGLEMRGEDSEANSAEALRRLYGKDSIRIMFLFRGVEDHSLPVDLDE